MAIYACRAKRCKLCGNDFAKAGQLTLLEDLYLYENQLGELPKEIGQLTLLEDLYLDENQLPKKIGRLTNLRMLAIYNGFISASQVKETEEILPNCQIYT